MNNDKQATFEADAERYCSSRFDNELIDLMNRAEDDDEQAREELEQMPLSIELESHRPNRSTCQFVILLGTGGPADRIVVEVDEHGAIETAEYEYQDWFQCWYAPRQDRERVMRFTQFFYFECSYCEIDHENAR